MIEIIRNKSIRKTIAVISAICILIIIFLSPLQAYIYDIETYMDLYDNNNVFSIIEKDEAVKLTKGIIGLLKNGDNIEEFKLKSKLPFFTLNEISHLYDVRTLVQKFLTTFYISTLLFIICIILIIQKNYLLFLKNISYIFIFSSCIVIFIILLLYFFSNYFIILFEKFHYIFFPQGNWAFPEGSLLITLLPLNFFYDFL